MSSLTIRRIIVWVVSMILGFVIGALVVVVGLPLLKPESAGITIADFGPIYYLVMSFPIGLVFVVWFDHFMNTKILPD